MFIYRARNLGLSNLVSSPPSLLRRSFSPKASAVTSPNDREQQSLYMDSKANGEAGSVVSPVHFDYPFSELMVCDGGEVELMVLCLL